MTVREALIGFYKFNSLNLTSDFESHCVRVYIGCILAPVPNINARKKYLKFHDLHHIMSGYGIDRVGESEISAWELGSRSCRKPLISIMNLFALSTGFILKPSKVTRAFYRGCKSKNLYYLSDSMTEADIDTLQIENIQSGHLEIRDDIRYKWLRQIEFAGYVFFSMIIHVTMLIAGKLLLTAELVKNRLTSNTTA
ncbi:hypothetical protein BDD43_5796 [Mucilaginibacter gracilis]|uniref:Coenzyme Q (Ubiquinone) biosynthesis protein Coq4 n=1 Tax=Mucilaginibacter gracilis TaxID=423350 RepID=A0A495J943_9SPHI|nr:hypothetical protein [Mucilaginibacter gracilis]RKR85525.1 hypothetical protein BDD43_5796 [Mucilaginibacter gracilis]